MIDSTNGFPFNYWTNTCVFLTDKKVVIIWKRFYVKMCFKYEKSNGIGLQQSYSVIKVLTTTKIATINFAVYMRLPMCTLITKRNCTSFIKYTNFIAGCFARYFIIAWLLFVILLFRICTDYMIMTVPNPSLYGDMTRVKYTSTNFHEIMQQCLQNILWLQ